MPNKHLIAFKLYDFASHSGRSLYVDNLCVISLHKIRGLKVGLSSFIQLERYPLTNVHSNFYT